MTTPLSSLADIDSGAVTSHAIEKHLL